MSVPFASYPFDAAGVDLYSHPIFITPWNRAPTSKDIYPPGTRTQDNSVSPPVAYYTVGAGVWYSMIPSGTFTTLTVTGLSTLGALTQVGTASINASGAATTTIGTGGTGAVNIGNATGGTAVTGVLTVNGNIVKNVAGNKDVYTSLATTTTAGANSAGTVTLVGGTATISTTSVTAASKIRIYRQSVGATGAAATGNLSIGTITASTSFVINSVTAADATALATTDVSVVFWEIVN